jgi:hypothetical protein
MASAKIEFSADDGATWSVVDTAASNPGRAAWAAPSVFTERARVQDPIDRPKLC